MNDKNFEELLDFLSLTAYRVYGAFTAGNTEKTE
jgi:hypothetical protein